MDSDPRPPTDHIPRRPLASVHEVFYPGLFQRFEDTVEARLAILRRWRTDLDREKVRFFEWLLDRIDRKAFGAIQEDFLASDALDFEYLKFIDPVFWFEDKVAAAFSARPARTIARRDSRYRNRRRPFPGGRAVLRP